jgi:hypothetical protein
MHGQELRRPTENREAHYYNNSPSYSKADANMLHYAPLEENLASRDSARAIPLNQPGGEKDFSWKGLNQGNFYPAKISWIP